MMKFKNLLALAVLSFMIAISSTGLGRTVTTTVEPFAHAYIYNETAQEVKGGESVTFDSHGPMMGIKHDAGSSEITFDNAGTYMINFLAASDKVGSFFGLFFNGNLAKGSTYGTAKTTDHLRSGQIIVDVKANDKLTLRQFDALNTQNTSPAMLWVYGRQHNIGEKQPAVNASINIVQID